MMFYMLSELDEMSEQHILAASADRVSSWLALETSRESRHWLPWRPNYDVGESSVEDCEDPERVVVFDDLSGALFTIESTEDRFRFLCAFLDFVVGKFLPSVTGVEHSDFCFSEERIVDSSLWWNVNEAFPDAESLSAFNTAQLAQGQLEKVCTFVDNVYTLMIGVFEGDFRTTLTLRYMRFKMATVLSNNSADRRKRKHAEKELRQFFKSLLKQEQNRSNLSIWEQYACFEWEVGNTDDAQKVFETALAMASSLAVNEATVDSSNSSVIHLYSSYSRLELGIDSSGPSTSKAISDSSRKQRASRALRILAMAVNGYQATSMGKDTAAPEVVRARHFYQRRLDDMQATFAAVNSSDTENIKCCGRNLLDWSCCFALFQLLTIGLSAATSVLQNFQTCLCGRTTVSTTDVENTADSDRCKKFVDFSENSHFSALLRFTARLRIQLAQFCLSSSIAPLKVVRTALSNALTEFPNDVWFLKTFVDVELSSHISGRMQEYFHRAVNEATMPLPVLYTILAGRKRLLRLSTDAQAPCKCHGGKY